MQRAMARDDLYDRASADFGAALERLARSYEADPDKRLDLLQEIHFAIWRSLQKFAGECSLRTWIYRVAHNVAASHVIRHRRAQALVSLDEIESAPGDAGEMEVELDRQRALERLYALIRQLRPLERQVILLYLEGLDGASIGEITGVSAGNVATKIHRIKKILGKTFREGGGDGG